MTQDLSAKPVVALYPRAFRLAAQDVSELDRLVAWHGYRSRSEALRALLAASRGSVLPSDEAPVVGARAALVRALAAEVTIGAWLRASDLIEAHRSGPLAEAMLALGVSSAGGLGRALGSVRARSVTLADGRVVRLERSARTRRGYAWSLSVQGS